MPRASLIELVGSMDEESVRSLPVGTDLFHGTSAKEKFDVPEGPAFFGDTVYVARLFVKRRRGPKPRIIRLEVTIEVPQLALIQSAEDFDRLAESQGLESGPKDVESLINLVCGSGLDGWIIPRNYREGADIMLCEPSRWLEYRAEEKIS